ncbi:50S ribosomal protein L15 [Candidatus Daviesbacteria bacterium]|nr:50S ribosomal protein L15 [Candidatus Daviesbacteria bacterium]
MRLDELAKIKTKSHKRLGRGIASGKGKTAARGSKGQKARGKIPAQFIGGTLPLYKKLPLKKGQGNKSIKAKEKILSLADLQSFKSGEVVNLQTLLEHHLISQQDIKKGVKILNKGDVKNALIVKVPISKSAKEKIIKAKGTLE